MLDPPALKINVRYVLDTDTKDITVNKLKKTHMRSVEGSRNCQVKYREDQAKIVHDTGVKKRDTRLYKCVDTYL